LGALIIAFAVPAIAHAATPGDGHVRFGPLLFGLAVLVVAAKAGGLAAERLGQPAVLGELLVGIGLGNVVLPVLGHTVQLARSDPTLMFLGQVGVLILLFDVGLEADLRALAGVGVSSLLVALIGIALPMGLGWGLAAWWLPQSSTLVHVFIGATLTATSVGITARVLKDLGATQRREGQIILGAALLDDVLGLVVLAVVSGVATASVTGGEGISLLTIGGIVLRAALFLGATVVLGHFLSGPIVRLAGRTGHAETMLVIGLALCFTLAFVAEQIGLADIVGAFAAGLLLDPYGQGVRARADDATLNQLLHPVSSLFVPLFFVLMGLQVDVLSLVAPAIVGFAAILTVAALVGKVAAGAGVVSRGVDRLAVGIGMVPRGEVGLIFAGIGSALTVSSEPILSTGMFSAIVVMVLVTTLVAPIGLRWALARRGGPDRPSQSRS
jgi:Kef-type K+ transport system membrane component KefB